MKNQKTVSTGYGKLQASFTGIDENHLDTMIVVRTDNPSEFAELIKAAFIACPITRPVAKAAAPAQGTPSTPPTEMAPAVHCPRCGKPCYDNRNHRGVNDHRPLLKCQDQIKCRWILWEKPRTDKEKGDAELWFKRHPDQYVPLETGDAAPDQSKVQP